jgi:putative ABC transport system permease protein
VDTATAERELTALLGNVAAEHRSDYDRPSARVQTLADVFLGPVRPVLLVLWSGVATLLLVACLNVANLLLLRATERHHELAVRAALGVTRARLSRQLLTESLILAVLGGLCALPLAWIAIELVAAHGPSQLPRLAEASLDARALAVCLGVAMASGLLFGQVPLRQLARRDPARALQGVRGCGTVEAWRTRALLATGSVALAACLLVGAGLLVRTMSGLIRVAPGFDPRAVLTADVVLSGPRYDAESPERERALVTRFYDEVLARLRASPEVEAASAVSTLPLGGGLDEYGLHVEGRVLPNPEEAPTADRFVVQDHLLETLRIPLLRGRLPGPDDGAGAPLVVVIGRTTAERVFGNEDPIGHRVMLGPPTAPPRTIVGVVGDVRHAGLDAPPGLQVHVPQGQWAWAEGAMTLVVRARAGRPAALVPAVRRAVRQVDADQPVSRVREYESIVAESIGTRRFASWLLGAFSITAVILAVVGLYGALGVTVGLRRREIGVRLAMGANGARVRRMILAQGMRPAAVGIAAGLGLAMLGVTALDSLVFGVAPRDPATFAAVAVLLLAATGAACLVPVLRAGRVNPASALRSE